MKQNENEKVERVSSRVLESSFKDSGCSVNRFCPIRTWEAAFMFSLIYRVLLYVSTPRDYLIRCVLPFISYVEKKAILIFCDEMSEKYDPDACRDLRRYMNDYNMDYTFSSICEKDSFQHVIREGLLSFMDKTGQKLIGKKFKGSFASRIDQFQKSTGVNDEELKILLVQYMAENEGVVANAITELCEYCKLEPYKSRQNHLILKILTGIDERRIAELLSPDGTLRRFCFLSSDLSISPHITEYFNGTNKNTLNNYFFTVYNGKAVPFKDLCVKSDDADVITALWKNRTAGSGVNILLYGAPGTGKTEFARSFSKKAGAELYEIKVNGSEKSMEPNSIRTSFYVVDRAVNRSDAVILVDEADQLLNTDGSFSKSDKGTVNHMLDDSKSFVFWITNDFSGIHPSVMRRFSHTVRFSNLSASQRRAIWKKCARRMGVTAIIDRTEIQDCINSYPVDAGGITLALQTVKRISGSVKDPATVRRHLSTLLKAHTNAIGRKTKTDDNTGSCYSPDGLNIENGVENCISFIDNFNRAWDDEKDDECRLSLLFYGEPGTGKTAFARYLAERISRPIITVNASDMLDRYVGDTEKNIRKTFSEAQDCCSVLFIDEADSFLSGRQNADRTWEVTQVNEMLSAMEHFRGLLICATNFRDGMDSAAMRRFDMKLKFNWLTTEGLLSFYSRYFSSVKGTLDSRDRQRLLSCKCLTPGDFGTVSRQLRFNPKPLSHPEIVDALVREQDFKSPGAARSMGFR